MGKCWHEHITATDSSCGWSQTKRQRLSPTVSQMQTRSGGWSWLKQPIEENETQHGNCIQVQKRSVYVCNDHHFINHKPIPCRMTRWRFQGSQHIWRRFWWREGSWLTSIFTWPSNCSRRSFLILMAYSQLYYLRQMTLRHCSWRLVGVVKKCYCHQKCCGHMQHAVVQQASS